MRKNDNDCRVYSQRRQDSFVLSDKMHLFHQKVKKKGQTLARKMLLTFPEHKTLHPGRKLSFQTRELKREQNNHFRHTRLPLSVPAGELRVRSRMQSHCPGVAVPRNDFMAMQWIAFLCVSYPSWEHARTLWPTAMGLKHFRLDQSKPWIS